MPPSETPAEAPEPRKLSRSKISLAIECPRCFVLDVRGRVKRPDSYPFTLNIAVDALLKREFDDYRAAQQPHPMMVAAGIDAVPFDHPRMARWRTNFTGLQALHAPTNILVTGALDDVWARPDGALHVVDYKATAKQAELSPQLTDAPHHLAYRRQVELYQWLLRQEGFPVSDTAYFVYVNGDPTREAFGGRLEFRTTIVPHDGSDAWVVPMLERIADYLRTPALPPSGDGCPFCQYRSAARAAEDADR